MHQIPCPDHLEKRNDSFNTSLLKPQLSLGLCALMVTLFWKCAWRSWMKMRWERTVQTLCFEARERWMLYREPGSVSLWDALARVCNWNISWLVVSYHSPLFPKLVFQAIFPLERHFPFPFVELSLSSTGAAPFPFTLGTLFLLHIFAFNHSWLFAPCQTQPWVGTMG